MRIHDLQDLKQMLSIVTVDDERSLDRIEWTDDGQLMAVSSARGIVHVYLSNLPIIGNILFIFFSLIPISLTMIHLILLIFSVWSENIMGVGCAFSVPVHSSFNHVSVICSSSP